MSVLNHLAARQLLEMSVADAASSIVPEGDQTAAILEEVTRIAGAEITSEICTHYLLMPASFVPPPSACMLSSILVEPFTKSLYRPEVTQTRLCYALAASLCFGRTDLARLIDRRLPNKTRRHCDEMVLHELVAGREKTFLNGWVEIGHSRKDVILSGLRCFPARSLGIARAALQMQERQWDRALLEARDLFTDREAPGLEDLIQVARHRVMLATSSHETVLAAP